MLVAILAIIALLAYLVTRFVDEAVDDLKYRTLFNQSPEIRAYAYSMLELSLATIYEVSLIDGGKLYAPEQGWADPLNYADEDPPNGYSVTIDITDESTRLPINLIDESTLNRILEDTFDIDFGTARELSSTLADWIDEDENQRLNGAESEDYLDEEPPYRAANGPLQSLHELRLVKVWQDEFFDENVFPNQKFEQLDNLFSVSIKGPVNINSASSELLLALGANQNWDPDRIFDQLLDKPWFEELPDFLGSDLFTTEISLLRVTVKVTRGSVPMTLSALVETNFSSSSESSNRSLPDTSSERTSKTGTIEEQDAIQYPFKIIQLSEYELYSTAQESARYSAVDIQQ
ncbi:MAG: general secretion pathway protein GspK [Puniceicoccaceae bacterium]|nr:general secretion pathway protein GspK [Puniceicoccaceae bacterium]